MNSEQSEHERQWRDYRTVSGARPIKDFLLALPDEDRAAILEEMEYVRKHGRSVARHLRGDIYEVRTTYNTKTYRILFACEGHFHHILLSIRRVSEKDPTNTRNEHSISRAEVSGLAAARESQANKPEA